MANESKCKGAKLTLVDTKQAPSEESDIKKPTNRIKPKVYEAELAKLQIELLKLVLSDESLAQLRQGGHEFGFEKPLCTKLFD